MTVGTQAVFPRPTMSFGAIPKLLFALFLAVSGMLGVLQTSVPSAGAQNGDALGYASDVVDFLPGEYLYSTGCTLNPPIPNNQNGTASGALGAPDYLDSGTSSVTTLASLGNGGVLTLQMETPFAGSGDSEPDIFIWEQGEGEGYQVDVSADGADWTYVGEVEARNPGEQGFDIDAYGFNEFDQLLYVRITDLAHIDHTCNPGSQYSVTGADIDAVGVLSRPVYADLEIEKTSNVEDGAELAVGDVVEYTFTVTNTGTVDLTGVTVADELVGLSDITPASADIAAGESATFTATYTVMQGDVDAGEIVNTATSTGEPPTGCEQCTPPISPPGENIIIIPPDPAIEVTKSSNFVDEEAGLGETITYTFTATNTGNVTLTDVSITDELPGLSPIEPASVATLAPGEEATFTASYVVTEADVLAGEVENTATGTGIPPETCDDCVPPTHTPPPVTVIVEEPDPAMAVTKVPNSEGPFERNAIVEYTFTATNTGNVTLTDVSISDPLPGLSPIQPASVDSLAPGEVATFTASYQITEADVLAGEVVNTATGTGEPPVDCVDCETTIVPPPPVTVITEEPDPALSLVKTADTEGPVAVGDTITYSFTAINIGNVTLTDVTVIDELPGLEWVEGPNLGTLAPGESATGTATYVTTQTDIDNGGVANSATGTGIPPGELVPPMTPPTGIYVPGDDPEQGLELVKTADTEGPVAVGETITYSFTATNTGNVTLADVTVTDELPGLVWVNGPNLGALGPGESATGTATYVTTQADIDNGGVANSATGTGTPPGELVPPTSPPTGIFVPGEDPDTDMTLVKSADTAGPVAVGETITYSFVATNTGSVTLTDVTVVDELPGLVWANGPNLGTLAPGESATGTATYVTTQADINNGGVFNSAFSTGTPPDSCADCVPTSPPSNVEVPGEDPDQGLNMVKSVSPDTTINSGETLTYTFVVTNIGETAVDNVTVADPLPGISEINGPHGITLAPGESATFTATYVVTDLDVAAGMVMNTATGSGTGIDGGELTSVDSVAIRACAAPESDDDMPAGTPPAENESEVNAPEIGDDNATPPAVETPVEEVPTEEAPVEEVPTEEAPVEEVPTEEAPVEEVPTEEAPVEEVPTEEVPTEEVPTEDVPTEEAPTEDTEPTNNDPDAGEAQNVSVFSFQALEDCEPLPVDPGPDPDPAPQQPQRPGTSAPPVTSLPSTGQGASDSMDMTTIALVATGLGLVLAAGTLAIRRDRVS